MQVESKQIQSRRGRKKKKPYLFLDPRLPVSKQSLRIGENGEVGNGWDEGPKGRREGNGRRRKRRRKKKKGSEERAYEEQVGQC